MDQHSLSAAIEWHSLVELLCWRSQHQANQRAFTFLADGETTEIHISYGELDRQARVIGAQLQSLGAAGERVLLLYPPGLAFITAFFGCLYAGAIAVPLYPPRQNRPDPRLHAVLKDAQAAIALTESTVWATLAQRLVHAPDLAALKWLISDTLDTTFAQSWHNPNGRGDSLAFLQYTSGSTAAPKGVMVSHRGLLHNLAAIKQACGLESDSVSVSWLPNFHDMGLIDGILQPVYSGFPAILLPPVSFLQQPVRWLQAISRYGAVHSGGPNFAYDFCVRQITTAQLETLDLSRWRSAYNGAEPIRKETLEQFAARFKPYGFQANFLHPCYGLAEATLLVSMGSSHPTYYPVEADALEQHRVVAADDSTQGVRHLVGCGRSWLDTKIVIANPESLTRCAPDAVGEIWVGGATVAQGYWNRPQETAATFQAHLADTGEGPFLRTGDLGFLRNGELFVTGRLKDIIIIRGRNHYPQDIELTATHSHPALQPDSGAAFSLMVAGGERLVIVQEVSRRSLRQLNVAEVAGAIRQAVAEQHELQLHAIVLLKTGSIPKTSSGKIQRHACRIGFLEDSLAAVGRWSLEEKETGQTVPPLFPQPPVQTGAAIQSWLIDQVARRLNMAPETIDPRAPFAHYGLDSVTIVSLSGELGRWLDRQLSPTLAYDYPSIEALAHYLAAEADAPPAVSLRPAPGGTAEPIAIIGLGCRFPGARNPQAFWEILRQGIEVVGEIPADRWNVADFYDPDPALPGKMYTRAGAFLDQVDGFDPQFFGISPREARSLDPQQRLLLEVSWEALEHAGLAPDQLRGSQSGVFVGMSVNDYARFSLNSGDVTRIDAYHTTGNSLSIAAGRISYVLGWHGPTMQVDTACSSSLVALHLACQSLRLGECKLALAGGVNLILRPEVTIGLCQLQALSADGHCRTFDAKANGYVRGEGCGMVVLKRLADALADGDNILAVVRSSAVNHDGLSNGLTAPNGLAQQRVIRQALANGHVAPAEVSYVEAHGTGTILGDPIELSALAAVLGQGRAPDRPLVVGSVKTNLGHLEAAAGIASLIKTVLGLQNQAIPPHLHFCEPNPHIPWADLPVWIPTTLTPWPAGERPRLAGISSFGLSGTNVHVVVEEAPALVSVQNDRERPLHLLALSARTEEALGQMVGLYAGYLAAHPGLDLADVCFTANTGRSPFQHRLSLVAGSTAQAAEKLAHFATGHEAADIWSGQVQGRRSPQVVFLFTGQGAQYVDMGRHLYETQPTFRQTLDRCAEILQAYLDQPLRSILYPDLYRAEDQAEIENRKSKINETIYTQPALFALEYSLAKLWQSWGIEPDMVMGHSLGEYVAACIAGVFSLEDGLKFVAARARLMQALPPDGAMAALMTGEERVRAAIEAYPNDVAVAAINGLEHVVISGKRAVVQSVLKKLTAEGISTYELVVSHAFHSPLMEPIVTELARVAEQITCAIPKIKFVSNLTGKLAAAEVTKPTYWMHHLREPVRFADGMRTIQEQGGVVFLEIGPKPTLLGLGRECLNRTAEGSDSHPAALWLPSLRQGRDDWTQMLSSLAEVSVAGLPVNWTGFDGDYARRKVILPTYPFQRQRYWLDNPGQNNSSKSLLPLIDRTIKLPLHHETVFESEFSLARLPWLADHRLSGRVVAPGAGYLAMVWNGAKLTASSPVYRLDDVIFTEALVIPEGGARIVQLVFAPGGSNGEEPTFDFRLISFEAAHGAEAFSTHATGRVAFIQPGQTPKQSDLETARLQCREAVTVETLYQAAARQQLVFGPSFRWLDAVWTGEGAALGRLRLPDAVGSMEGYMVHPGLLDACFQLAGVTARDVEVTAALRPFMVASVSLYQPVSGDQWWGCARQVGEWQWDIDLFDPAGQVLMEITGYEMRPVSPLTGFERDDGVRSPLFSEVRSTFGTSLEAGKTLLSTFLATPPTERERLLTVTLCDFAAHILGTVSAEVNPDEPLPYLGLDSLMAVELRNQIRQSLGIDLPVTKFLSGLTLAELAVELTGQLVKTSANPPVVTPASSEVPTPANDLSAVGARELLATLDQLTDEQIETLLASRLSQE